VEEVKVRTTGEEGEVHVFPATRSKLFQWRNGEWKESGVGKVTLNVSEADPSKARILFRVEQVGTIRLNAALFAGMKVEAVRSVSCFTCPHQFVTSGRLETRALLYLRLWMARPSASTSSSPSRQRRPPFWLS
jgi:hypothetical protein